MTLNSGEGAASPVAKKPWKKPEVRRIIAGSAEMALTPPPTAIPRRAASNPDGR